MTSRNVLLAVLVASLWGAAPAGAATVSMTYYQEPEGTTPEESCSRYMMCPPPEVSVVDSASEANDLTLDVEGVAVVVRDAKAPLTAGSNCSGRADGSVSCSMPGAVSVSAGGGDDRVVTRVMASVHGGDGNDVLTGPTLDGGAGDDTLTGDERANTLTGGPGADTIEAGAGDDIVTDGEVDVLSADRFDGGEGRDNLSFTGRTQGVLVDLGASPQTGGTGTEGNVVSGFENARGGSGADELLGPVDGASDGPILSLYGGDGDDRLVARSQSQTYLWGEADDDTLVGGPGVNQVAGGDGDDRITGGALNDNVHAGAGRDEIDVGDGDDVVRAQDGADVVLAGAGADLVTGGSGNDVASGGEGDDRLQGGRGDDNLRGEAGDDFVRGDAGRDVLVGDAGDDRVLGRDRERDRLSCGAGSDRASADRGERARSCESVARPKRRRG